MYMTVNDFTSKAWYVAEIAIIGEKAHQDAIRKGGDLIDNIIEKSLWSGYNRELQSDTLRNVKNKYVKSFGAVDDYVVIIV